MSAVEWVTKSLGIEPAERRLSGWAVLCLLMMGAATLALTNTAETLFIKRVGVERLPLALLVVSGILVATTATVGGLAARNPTRVVVWVLVTLALLPLPFAWVVDSSSAWVLGGFLAVTRQVFALGLLSFWVAMGALVPARRAKQLFAPLGAGVTVGCVIGSFSAEKLAGLLGVDGLIGFCSLLLLGSAFSAWRAANSSTRPLERAVVANRVGSTAPVRTEASFGGLLRSDPLFRHLAIALVCGGAVSQIFYFEFSTIVDQATRGAGGEARLLGLYSQVRGWMNVVLLVSQIGISSFLYRHLGLPLSMALWPLVYVLGFGWIGIDFVLVAGVVSFSAARIIEDGVSDSASRVLYNLFPEGLRASVAGWLEGPVNRLGGVVANGFVLSAVAAGVVSWILWVGLAVGVVWLGSALRLWRTYPELLLRAAADHGLDAEGEERAQLVDAATQRALAERLEDPDPNVCRAALDLIGGGGPEEVVRLLCGALGGADAPNRPLLVERLQETVEGATDELSAGREALEALAEALGRDLGLSPEERGDLLRMHARLSRAAREQDDVVAASRALLWRALGDRDAPVRLAAVVGLHQREEPPPGLPDLDRVLADALAASDAIVRRAARRELRLSLLAAEPDARASRSLMILAEHLGNRADRAETAEALCAIASRHGDFAREVAERALAYVRDRDPRVRAAVLELAGRAGLADAAPLLVESLGVADAGEARGARDGLVALGAEAALPLLVGFELGGPARREAVLSVLRELEVDRETLRLLVEEQLSALRERVIERAALEGRMGEAASLLALRLEERLAEGLGALLGLLSASEGDPRLARIERQLRRAGEGPERDVLIEALETMLGRRERAAVLPLVEIRDWTAAAAEAARDLPRTLPAPEETLRALATSKDETTRRLALALTLDDSDQIGDPGTMPSALEIAAFLQSTPAFDRLSVEQCLSLAGGLQEQKLAAGERLYREGEEGTALYFVLEGEIDLCRGSLVLERVPAGSYLGELSTIDGIPRSADAVARTEARVLRLEQEELLMLVDNAPSFAIGLAQRLSARVRRLEDRLVQAREGEA